MRGIVLILVALLLASMLAVAAVVRADDAQPTAWSSVRLNFQRSATVATAGSKVLFAGVEPGGAGDVVVRMYEGATGRWSAGALSETRGDFVATTVGSQALFIGGIGAQGPSTTVDIYDSTTDRWSVGRLSHPIFGGGTPADPRVARTAVTVGSRVALLGSYTDTTGARPAAFDLYDSDTGAWSTVPLPRAREHPLMVAVGTRVLFVTGTGPEQWTLVDAYDTATGQWTTGYRAEACTPRVAVVGTRALLACGRSATGLTDVVDVYDSQTGAWSVGKLSQARTEMTIATAGSLVLFAGGVLSGPPDVATSTYSDRIDVYDSVSGQWTTGQLSQPSLRPAVASVGTRVLFASGFIGTDPAVPPLSRGPGLDSPLLARYSDAVDVYDSATGRWSRGALAQGRGHLAVATVGDRVLFAGGSNSRGGRNSDERFALVDVYDATDERWSTASLSYPHVPMTTAVVADKVLFIGHRMTCSYCPPGPADVVVDIYDAAADRP